MYLANRQFSLALFRLDQYFSLGEPFTWPLGHQGGQPFTTRKNLPSGLFACVCCLCPSLWQKYHRSLKKKKKKRGGKGSISHGEITPGRVLSLYDGSGELKRSHESSWLRDGRNSSWVVTIRPGKDLLVVDTNRVPGHGMWRRWSCITDQASDIQPDGGWYS